MKKAIELIEKLKADGRFSFPEGFNAVDLILHELRYEESKR